jgi:multiple sugar transport system permease protein
LLRKLARKAAKSLIILIIVTWSVFPVAYIFINSFKLPRDIFAFPPSFPFMPTLTNYIDLARTFPTFFTYMGNSLVISVCATLLSVGAAALAGYVYSRYRSRPIAASAFYLVGVRLLPPLVATIPLFPWVNSLGLADTRTILVLLYAAFWVSMNTLVMKEFIDRIPRTLDEAAAIDGASEAMLFGRIILPLTLQGLVACAVFVFVFSWNEYLYAFIFAIQNAKTTPLILSEIMDSVTGTNYGVLFAAATVQMVPVVVLVLILQRFLIAGLTAGAVKE